MYVLQLPLECQFVTQKKEDIMESPLKQNSNKKLINIFQIFRMAIEYFLIFLKEEPGFPDFSSAMAPQLPPSAPAGHRYFSLNIGKT
jgi:hypothetical protein